MPDQTAKDTPYHHGNLRQALIEAGLEILEQEGSRALSLRKAARKAGVSHTAPYRHFANKEALIAAIAEEGYRELEARMRQALAAAPPDDYRSRLTALGWAYIQFALEHPHHLRVMFGDFPETCQPDAGDSFTLLVQTIAAGQAAQAIVPGDPLQFALSLWATVHGLATLLAEHKIPAIVLNGRNTEEFAKACLQIPYDGLMR